MAVPRVSSPHPSTAPTPVTLERIRNRINEIAPGDLYEAAPDGLVIPTSIGMILIRIDGPLLRITATWAPPVPSGLVSALKVELSVRNAGQPLLAASLFPVDMFGGHQVVGAATIPIAHGMNDDQLFFCIDSHVDYCESFFDEFEQRFPESRFDEEVALIEAEQAAEDAAAHEAGEQRNIADDDPEFMEIIQNLGPLGPAEITHQLAELARSRIAPRSREPCRRPPAYLASNLSRMTSWASFNRSIRRCRSSTWRSSARRADGHMAVESRAMHGVSRRTSLRRRPTANRAWIRRARPADPAA